VYLDLRAGRFCHSVDAIDVPAPPWSITAGDHGDQSHNSNAY
jgi:hypothetical protein